MAASDELDKIPVEYIRRTITALRQANADAFRFLGHNPGMVEYVRHHETVADALETYCNEREANDPSS